MEPINVRKATESGIKALTRKMEKLLKDQNGKFYQDNVVKFGQKNMSKRLFQKRL